MLLIVVLPRLMKLMGIVLIRGLIFSRGGGGGYLKDLLTPDHAIVKLPVTTTDQDISREGKNSLKA